VIIDIGTGDGRFVYQSARAHPDRFYIGVDAQAKALERTSSKIYRKPAKGGLPNALFIQASVESLPPELDGVADEVHIHFPWGSLLRAVALGEEFVLRNLRRICAPCAWIEIVIALDPERDGSEIARLGLESLSPEFFRTRLIPRYHSAGFDSIECGEVSAAEWPHLPTSWAQRLAGSAARPLSYLIARAADTRTERSR
jgi:16S rRNA (adenine(1408)-N(1))-methyltransferase